MQEVKEEFEQKRASDERGVDVENGNLDADGIGTLSEVLDHIRAPRGSSASRVQTELARKLDKSSRTDSETSPAGFAPQTTNGSITSHSSSKQQDHALAKAAEFDTRLALLEKALGVNTSSTQSTTKPILPTLEQLSQQVTTLSGSSTSSLDSISRKVRQLTQEAERLESTRKAAKAAQDALKESPRSGRAVPNDGGVALEQDTTDSEQVAKINALYGTLGTIESLSPILPSVLDRLRSLRIIHADAATASENLNAVEQRQEEMAGEIKRWREGLERVESAMKEGEGVMGSNIKVVEGWVKDLEVRMKRLNQ